MSSESELKSPPDDLGVKPEGTEKFRDPVGEREEELKRWRDNPTCLREVIAGHHPETTTRDVTDTRLWAFSISEFGVDATAEGVFRDHDPADIVKGWGKWVKREEFQREAAYHHARWLVAKGNPEKAKAAKDKAAYEKAWAEKEMSRLTAKELRDNAQRIRDSSIQPLSKGTIESIRPTEVEGSYLRCELALHHSVLRGDVVCVYDTFRREEIVQPGAKAGRHFTDLRRDRGVDKPNMGLLQRGLSCTPENCPPVPDGEERKKPVYEFNPTHIAHAVENYAAREQVNTFHNWVLRMCVPAYRDALKRSGKHIDFFELAAEKMFAHCCREWTMGANGIGKSYVVETIRSYYRAGACRGCVDYSDGVEHPVLWALTGGQGWGKSDTAKYTFSPEFYTDAQKVIFQDPKDMNPALAGIITVELGEMQEAKTAGNARLKAVLSISHTKGREVYQRKANKVPIRSVFIATGNVLEYLRDPTGSRRHNPFNLEAPIGKKGLQWLQQHYRILIGQAYTEVEREMKIFEGRMQKTEEIWHKDHDNKNIDGEVENISARLREMLNIPAAFPHNADNEDLWDFREDVGEGNRVHNVIGSYISEMQFRSFDGKKWADKDAMKRHSQVSVGNIVIRKRRGQEQGEAFRVIALTTLLNWLCRRKTEALVEHNPAKALDITPRDLVKEFEMREGLKTIAGSFIEKCEIQLNEHGVKNQCFRKVAVWLPILGDDPEDDRRLSREDEERSEEAFHERIKGAPKAPKPEPVSDEPPRGTFRHDEWLKKQKEKSDE